MTLTLAEPDANPIRTYDNGLKVVRLTDYVGAARGTLSTVADTAAVAGNVVKDEQTIAIPTTFGSKWSLVADTITIPVADFNYSPTSNYTGYLSVRSQGRPPVTGRSFEKFNLWNSDAGPQVQLGYDGVQQSSTMPVPREHYANYNMLGLGGFGPNWDGGSTNVNIRAWGIAGGATTFAWYLDCLYLVPTSLADSDTGGSSVPGRFQWFVGQSVIDPTLPATDDDNNTALGSRSVFFHPKDGVFDEDGAGWDIQDSAGENTEFDWHDVGFFGDENRELSYINWVGLTSRLINYHQIESCDFSDTLPDPSPAGPYNQTYRSPEGYQFFVSTVGAPTQVGEYYFAAGAMRFRSFSVAFGEVPPSFYPRASVAPWSLGAITHNLDTFSATDPRTYTPQLDSLESFVVTQRCVPTDGIATSGLTYALQGQRFTGENTANITAVTLGPRVDIASSGAATVQFRFKGANIPGGESAIGSSVAVPDNLSTAFWIKLEKRLYVWRCKIWLDGNAEPSSWLLTVDEPASLVNSITGGVTLLFPWDTGYPVSGTTTPVNIPDVLPDEIDTPTGIRGWTIGGSLNMPSTFNQQAWRFDIDDILVEYDPDIEGTGDYTNANFTLEKYDGSETWGTVSIDPGMSRVAFSDYAAHHFDNDQHGGNIMGWKDAGAHPLQTAGYGIMWFRRYVQGNIPLHRPRVFSVRAF